MAFGHIQIGRKQLEACVPFLEQGGEMWEAVPCSGRLWSQNLRNDVDQRNAPTFCDLVEPREGKLPKSSLPGSGLASSNFPLDLPEVLNCADAKKPGLLGMLWPSALPFVPCSGLEVSDAASSGWAAL